MEAVLYFSCDPGRSGAYLNAESKSGSLEVQSARIRLRSSENQSKMGDFGIQKRAVRIERKNWEGFARREVGEKSSSVRTLVQRHAAAPMS
jgi:hypothetical protein